MFNQVIAGEIKNVHTSKDWILAALYSACETDRAMGRSAVFTEQFMRFGSSSTRCNLLGKVEDVVPMQEIASEEDNEFGAVVIGGSEEEELRAVASPG